MNHKTNDLPLVSVLVPVYNAEKYLAETLDSILNQTYKNLEIILVDDGSTDSSGKICDMYREKDSRIRVIHQENNGINGARNAALDASTGDLISFLDADDVYLPNMLETLVDAMHKEQADIVACRFYRCRSTGKLDVSGAHNISVLQCGSYSSADALVEVFNCRISFMLWDKIFDRRLFDDVRFDGGRIYGDIGVIPRLFERADKVVCIPEPLVLYRKWSGSNTAAPGKNPLDFLNAIKKCRRFVEDRTPSAFEAEKADRMLEGIFLLLLSKYSRIRFHRLKRRKISPDVKKAFAEEIKLEAGRKRSFSRKTRRRYTVYRLDPHLYSLMCSYDDRKKKKQRHGDN